MLSSPLRIVSAALLALAAGATSFAQPPDGRRFGPPVPGMEWFGLLGQEEVREELELIEDQVSQLDTLREESMAAMQELFGDLRDLEPEERRAKMDELRPKMEERAKATRAKLEGILLPNQVTRLRQIGLQAQGARALLAPEFAEALQITDSQREEMESIRDAARDEMREAMQAARDSGDFDREAMQAERRKMEEAAEAKVLALLTDDQRAKFKEMQGEPVTFELRRGPGGRFGGGGGFGGGEFGPGEGRGRRERGPRP